MHLGRTLVATLRSLSFVLLAGPALPACQAVLGDFEVADVEPDTLGTACEPGSFRCSGANLERCKDNRRGYEPFATCASAGACDPTAGACRACVTGDFACNADVLVLCTDGAWAEQATCDTPALCRVNPDRRGGMCKPPVCDAGSFQCEGGRLVACAATRDRFELVEDCGAPERCDAAAAAAAVSAKKKPHCASAACGDACPPAVCEPGTTRCSREVPAVELCGTDGQWTNRDVCAVEALCDASRGRCFRPACAAGETRCVGSTRETCSEDQSRFEFLEECGDGGTCTPAGCVATRCMEGTERCNGVAYERCLEGDFVAVNRCATPALCKLDATTPGCQPPVCGEDLQRFECSPDLRVLRSCLPGREGYRNNTCPTNPINTQCDAAAGLCLQIP